MYIGACAKLFHTKQRPSTCPDDDPFKARKNEVVCEIASTRFAQHWSLRDLPKRFVAQMETGMWWMHSRISNRLQTFLVSRPNSLPQFVSLDDTIFGAQFQITRRYPESMALLMNWATHFCEELLNNPGKRLGGVGADVNLFSLADLIAVIIVSALFGRLFIQVFDFQ